MNSRMAMEPKHRRLSEQLKQRLIVENLAPGDRFLSVREIAKEYSVSLVTAHRSLRELVAGDFLDIRQFQGCFVGAAVGNLLKSNVKPLITILTSEALFSSFDDYLPEYFMRGLRASMPNARIRVEYIPAQGTTAFLESLIASQAPSVYPQVYVLRSVDPSVKRFFADRNQPAVVTGNLERGIDLPSVQRDERQIMHSVVEFLLARNHKRIAYVEWDANLEGHRKRREGYVAAMRDHRMAGGARELEELCMSVPLTESRLAAVTRQLLAIPSRPTAIIYGQERQCAWGLRAIMQLGLTTPDDVAIVALAGGALADHLVPRPTFVPRKDYEDGAAVGAYIAKLLKGEPITDRVTRLVSTLVERETT